MRPPRPEDAGGRSRGGPRLRRGASGGRVDPRRRLGAAGLPERQSVEGPSRRGRPRPSGAARLGRRTLGVGELEGARRSRASRKATPDPPHGRIERDASGEPSGDAARGRGGPRGEPPAAAHARRTTRKGCARRLQIANGFGLTSLEEASASEADLEAYAALDAAGALTARVSASITVRHRQGRRRRAAPEGAAARYRGKRFHADGAKIFADGVLETRTAAVLEPYIGFGTDRGKPNLEPADFRALATALDKEGFQIHVHAIGDRAVRRRLDAIEAAQKANGVRDARHHIAHLELDRPGRHSAIPAPGRPRELSALLGQRRRVHHRDDRARARPRALALDLPDRERRRRGRRHVAFGSDWSVSSMNPLDGIEVAVTHREPAEARARRGFPRSASIFRRRSAATRSAAPTSTSRRRRRARSRWARRPT